MRFHPAMLSMTMIALLAPAAGAGHFEEVEDATDAYYKAVRRAHKEIKKERHAPPYLVQLAHRLDGAADRLEERADDKRDAYAIHAAFEEVAVLHDRFSELTHDPRLFGRRHTARRLDELQRRFAELAIAMERLSTPVAFGRRDRSSGYLHRPPRHAPPPPQHKRRGFELRIDVGPPAPGKRHHLDRRGRKIDRALRKGRVDKALRHWLP